MSVNVWNKSHMLESHHRTNWKQLASSFRLKETAIRLDTSEISEKCEVGLNPRFPSIFAQDHPAERLSSSFPPAGSASGSTHEKDRDEEISKASECQSDVIDSVSAPPDILLLYWTLVKDGVPPRGYESQFAILETAILKGARRALKRTAGSDNLTAAVWLHQRNLQSQQKQHSERLAVDQFLLAALDRPSKFRARWQEKYYDGPNARPDAEQALRTKWLQELEALLMGTKTPMGEALSNKLGDRSFLGGGRRASTLRARVRASKKYLAWLAVSADVAFPSGVSRLTGFLESRHSEPCNRGALKAAHQCMAFLEDVAGIDEKLTTNALHGRVQGAPRHSAARAHAETGTPVPCGSFGVARRIGPLRKCNLLPPGLRVVVAPSVLGDTQVRGPPRTQSGKRL